MNEDVVGAYCSSASLRAVSLSNCDTPLQSGHRDRTLFCPYKETNECNPEGPEGILRVALQT